MVPALFTLVAKRQDTLDTWTLELEPRSGARLAFAPGQFTMLSAFGTGEVPISISGGADGPLTHTVRAVGLATQAICDAQEGDVLTVRGPFGRPWPVEELAGADVVIVAGGIGLAPLRPAILAVLADRERYGRVALLYGGRSPDQLLFGDRIHGVPEPAVVQCRHRRTLKEAVTGRGGPPVAEGQLRTRGDHPVQGGQRDVGAHRQRGVGASGADNLVDDVDHAETLE